jgi:CBS domain-containing protein
VRPDADPALRPDDPSMTEVSGSDDVPPQPHQGSPIAEAMRAGLVHCAPRTPLRTVARLMATRSLHAVYVFDDRIDEPVPLWGLVSDVDVMAALPVIDDRTAGDAAVAPLVTISLEESLERAAELMAAEGATYLAVLDPATERPVGMITTLDVARVVAGCRGVGDPNAGEPAC